MADYVAENLVVEKAEKRDSKELLKNYQMNLVKLQQEKKEGKKDV